MNNKHLVVNEPWGRYLEGAANRLSRERIIIKNQDLKAFVNDHMHKIGSTECFPLDFLLISLFFKYRKSQDENRRIIRVWLKERGFSSSKIIQIAFMRRFKRFFKFIFVMRDEPYLLNDRLAVKRKSLLTMNF